MEEKSQCKCPFPLVIAGLVGQFSLTENTNSAVDDEETQDSDVPSTSNLMLENRSLRNRIRQLESALSRPELLKVDMGIARPASASSHNFQSSEGILSNFQMQAFGLSAEPTREHNGHTRRWDDSVKLILPTRRWSETITQFSLLHLGWVHCALDATTFSKEHDAFWNSLIEEEQDSLTKHGWIAVYLSVLAVSLRLQYLKGLRFIRI